MSAYRTVIDAVAQHITECVLGCRPTGGTGMSRFKQWRGEKQLSVEGSGDRVFDVVHDSMVHGPSIGNTTHDYEAVLNIEISYKQTGQLSFQIAGDYDAIRRAIRESDKSALTALGFGYARVDGYETQDGDDDQVFAIIPVTVRVDTTEQ